MMSPEQALSRWFGYSSFRGAQDQVIRRVANGGHALVIMPTGMGKSLCFQIPALMNHADRSQDTADGTRPSLCLVLSPLIALMKDQVDSLQDRDIPAAYINSSLRKAERERRYQEIADGRHALLYVTPERFRKPEFLEVLQRRTVSLLAVDEAHCISEWGHDFRPDYTRVGEFRELLGNPTTIALTATATPEVQTDILRQLNLQPEEVDRFHEGIDRPNLMLDVREVWDTEEKLAVIREVRERRDRIDASGSGIVYFTLIRTLEEFSDQLRKQGVDHVCYHGDLDRRRRRDVQEDFMSGRCPLVLATNAFGMGVDKEDIRFVIHADIPGSMESYYQEIGRAGRDGNPSECVLLYDQNDLNTQMQFIQWSNPDAEYYERVWDHLQRDTEQIRAFGLEWLREKLSHRNRSDRRLETVLSMLQRYGCIEDEHDLANIRPSGKLPAALSDAEVLSAKLMRDQKKLYALVQYVQQEPDNRKTFIHEYFGLPVPDPSSDADQPA